jgi:hypothetical protein
MQQERMVTQTPSATGGRDPWRLVWQTATSDGLLVILLLAAAGLLAAARLPQAPDADPATYARWLSETQARFGKATQTMQALGLFAIARSFVFRALLSLLGGVLLLRFVERGNRLFSGAGRREPSNLYSLLAHGGGLLVLAGLLITHLWGWQVGGLIVQGGGRTPVPGTAGWVALKEDTLDVTHSPGIVTFTEALGPGVRVSAADDQGNLLVLQQTTGADSLTELTLALTGDQHFAIPDAQLLVQLAPQADQPIKTDTPVLVQVYSYPPIRLETEAVVEGDAELAVNDAQLRFTSAPYAQVTATFNPGLWPTGVGLALSILGLGATIVWPTRRTKAGEEN